MLAELTAALVTLEALGVCTIDQEAPTLEQGVTFSAMDKDILAVPLAYEALDMLADQGLLHVAQDQSAMYVGHPDRLPEGVQEVTPRCAQARLDDFSTWDLFEALEKRAATAGMSLSLEHVREDLPNVRHGRPRTVTEPDTGTVPASVFASMCGVTTSTLRDWRAKGQGPQAVSLTQAGVEARYNRQDALAFAQAYQEARNA